MAVDIEEELRKYPDVNPGLVQFFDEQYPWLSTVPLREIPLTLKKEIASIFHSTNKGEEWMLFVDELMMMDTKTDATLKINTITTIEYAAPAKRVTPLEEAFIQLSQKSLGEVMKVFADLKKFNILRHVKPHVEEMKREMDIVQPSAPLWSQEISILNSIGNNCGGSKENIPVLEKSSMKTSVIVTSKDTLSGFITVFIWHVLSEEKTALRVARDLHDQGMVVLLSNDIFPYLLDHHVQTMTRVNDVVDFIVPVISEELLKQISSEIKNVKDVDHLETISNRYLYDLVSREYCKTGKNLRVRPVKSSFKGDINYPVLSCPLSLSDIPFLIENLKFQKSRVKNT